MKYEFRGTTLEQAVQSSLNPASCKRDNHSECERISRLRANHANNIATILGNMAADIENLNLKVENLGNDAVAALGLTVVDLMALIPLGHSIIRALRHGERAVEVVMISSSTLSAIINASNNVQSYRDRIAAFSKWREVSNLRASLMAQGMDLNRSIRVLRDLNDEWTRLGCGQRDANDPRGRHKFHY
jgi:hypothetical protein